MRYGGREIWKEKKGMEEPGTDYGMGECLVQKGSLGKSRKILVHLNGVKA